MASRTAILAIRVIADAAGGKQGLAETATGVQKFEQGVERASVRAGVALAGIAAAAWSAAGSASRLAESANAAGLVFGPAAKRIEAFGATAATSVGLAQAEFQELATSTGSLLTNMGYSQDAAAESTLSLTQRAADMASVFNTDVGTALNAINSGLRGEAEPLRAFGVGLTDAAVKAEAVTLGLYSGTGALTANAKAAATQSLIMKQTAKTAGDFANTSDSLANRQRTLAATFEDTKAKLGTALLPAMELFIAVLTTAATWASDNTGAVRVLVAAVAVLAGGILAANVAFKAYSAATAAATAVQAVWNSTLVASTARMVANVAATVAWNAAWAAIRVATIAATAAQWALNAALTANPVGLVVAAVALLVAGLVLAYKKSETFRDVVDALGSALKTGLGFAVNLVRGYFDAYVTVLSTAWRWMQNLIDKAGELVSKLNPLKSLGGILGRVTGASATGYTAAPLGPSLGRAEGATARTAGPTYPAGTVTVTEDQIYRAVARLLLRGDARNGRTVLVG